MKKNENPAGSNIEITIGDLLFLPSGALICPCQFGGRHDNGVCRQILQLAGKDLERDIKNHAKREGAYLSSPYRLGMRQIKNILHLNISSEPPLKASIAKALDEAFILAEKKEIQSVSIGSLNASAFGISWQDAANLISVALSRLQPTENPISIRITDSNLQFITKIREVLHAPA
ncbi:MAG: macro domain-containing protein [Bacteroidetes bacterium]|nr:macro domain-containing protein [Bacteroidota bacterium]